MPLCGCRSQSTWILNPLRSEPPEQWFKISIGIYIVAMIPYLLQSIAASGVWTVSTAVAGGLEMAGAVAFVVNSLFDLWVSVRTGEGKFGCLVVAGESRPPWVERLPRLNFIRNVNWFFFGSVVFVSASILYLVAPIFCWYVGGDPNVYLPLYLSAAAMFIIHAGICIMATLVLKAEPGTRKTYLIRRACKRWQDFDWLLIAGITFMFAAIFDVVVTYVINFKPNDFLVQGGGFISSIGWLINASLYMIAAFAGDFSPEDDENDDGNSKTWKKDSETELPVLKDKV